MPTTGRGEYPFPNAGDVPDVARFVRELGEQIALMFDPIDEVADLPAAGITQGQRVQVNSTPGAEWEWTGSAWRMHGIAWFADAAARDAAIPAPQAGYVAYLTSTQTFTEYAGGAWVNLFRPLQTGVFATAVGYTINTNSYLRKDRTGFVWGYINVTRAAGLQTNTVYATLPDGFRPAETYDTAAVSSEGSGVTAGAGFGRVGSDGAIRAFAVQPSSQRFGMLIAHPAAGS